jgi:hypothetical protein
MAPSAATRMRSEPSRDRLVRQALLFEQERLARRPQSLAPLDALEQAFLEEARSKVDEVVDELAKFRVVSLEQEPGGIEIDTRARSRRRAAFARSRNRR